MARQSLKSVARLIDIENKEVPVEDQFRHDLERSIEIQAANNRRPPSRTFKPSSLHCPRDNYYQIMGEKVDVSERTSNSVGITTSGSNIHEWVQLSSTFMSENGMPWSYIDVGEFVEQRGLEDLEVREKKGFETKLFNKRYNMSFMCDGIIRRTNGNSYEYYILEIKTETSNKWYHRAGVDPKHFNQAIAYSLSFGLDSLIFLYVDRDMLGFKTFRFDVTDEMRHDLVVYIQNVKGYVDRKIAPPKPSEAGRGFCQYCGYKSACKRDG